VGADVSAGCGPYRGARQFTGRGDAPAACPCYQDAFFTPGIMPCSASSRNAMRLKPNIAT
jgi:hypothetical protein